MIGRAAQGRPWFPGQVARYLATGRREPAPPLAEQFTLIDTLYDEMLSHHGLTIGRRHARKHLGWALDSAAATAGVSSDLLKAAPRPRAHGRRAGAGAPRARRCLRRFRMESCRMSRAHAVSATVNSPADAVLHALPHPVIMVSPDGKIADANVAAEQFFEASIPVLRRHMLRDLVPFGSPLLTLVEQVRAARRGGQ